MNPQAYESGSCNDFFQYLSFPIRQRDSSELNFELHIPWQRVVDTESFTGGSNSFSPYPGWLFSAAERI